MFLGRCHLMGQGQVVQGVVAVAPEDRQTVLVSHNNTDYFHLCSNSGGDPHPGPADHASESLRPHCHTAPPQQHFQGVSVQLRLVPALALWLSGLCQHLSHWCHLQSHWGVHVLRLQWHGTWPHGGPDVVAPAAAQSPSPETTTALLWCWGSGTSRTSLGSLEHKQLWATIMFLLTHST